MALDGLSVVLAFWSAAMLRPALNTLAWIEDMPTPILNPPILYFVFPFIWVGVNSLLSIYDGRKYLRVVDEFAALTVGAAVASVSSAGILYFSYRQVSRALFLIFIVLAYALFLSWRALARLYFRSQKLLPDRDRRVLVAGSGSLGQKVRGQLEKAGLKNLAFIGFVDNVGEALGRADEIRDIIQKNTVTDVVIALPHSEYHQLGDIVQQLETLPVQVWVALGFFDLALYNMNIEDFAGIPMLDLRASAIDEYQRMLKRGFDLVLGLTALIIGSPFMALSALLILIEDGSPVLFRQTRVGENGRLFKMLKFRTMVKNAEQLRSLVERPDENGNILHKVKDDPRVTRVGRFLRRTSLDELPQLINVLAGEMSLVGPRPELPYLVENYQPWQRKRFAVPPGITGWWQVIGRSDRAMHLHTEDDLYYVQNYSIWLDLQIILRTIWTVFLGKGAY